MIDYFIRPLGGVSGAVGATAWRLFAGTASMGFRRKPAGIVTAALDEGGLNLFATSQRRPRRSRRGRSPATVTSPYMLARTLLDEHYHSFERLTLALADLLAEQVSELPCACVQVDEANVTGNPEDADLAAEAINRVLDAVTVERAVHFCFGNYGGQTIQKGEWKKLTGFLSKLHTNHLVLEVAHRPPDDLEALRDVDPRISLGIGVIDVKVNHIETADEVARRLETAEKALGAGRVGWAHPDCGFWMLKRSIADRKMEALVKGRDLYLAR